MIFLFLSSIRSHLKNLLLKLAQAQGLSDMSMLTKDFHVWPDFHGNRSPLADPTMKGMIIGLTIDRSEENLALLYLATLQALSVRNLIYYYERAVSYALLRPPSYHGRHIHVCAHNLCYIHILTLIGIMVQESVQLSGREGVHVESLFAFIIQGESE